MSKKEQIVAKLKELAKIALSKELKFTDAKTIDGVIIRYEEDVLETGVIVSVVDESGQVLIAPIGSYALEDGTTFDVVDDLGTADNVVMAEEEAPIEENMEETNVPVASAPAVEQAAKSVIETVSKETRFEEAPKEVEVEAEPIVTAEMDFATHKLAFEKEIKEVNEKVEATELKLKELFKLIEAMGTEEEVKTPSTKENVFKYNNTSRDRAKELKERFRAQLGK